MLLLRRARARPLITYARTHAPRLFASSFPSRHINHTRISTVCSQFTGHWPLAGWRPPRLFRTNVRIAIERACVRPFSLIARRFFGRVRVGGSRHSQDAKPAAVYCETDGWQCALAEREGAKELWALECGIVNGNVPTKEIPETFMGPPPPVHNSAHKHRVQWTTNGQGGF